MAALNDTLLCGVSATNLPPIIYYLCINQAFPAGNALWFCQNFFFRHQGFRMITPEFKPVTRHGHRKKCIVFRPRATPAWGAPNTPKSAPLPRKKKLCMRFRTPGTFLKNKIQQGKKLKTFFCVLRPQEDVFARKIQLLKTPAQPSEHSPQSWCNNKYSNNCCVRYGLQPPYNIFMY